MAYLKIPVEKRLPENDLTVITLDEVNTVRVMAHDQYGWKAFDEHDGQEFYNSNLKIKFWLEEVDISLIENKARKWDILESKISKYYLDEEGKELPDDNDATLESIGETAARAFGFM